jgi:hypothetical protein
MIIDPITNTISSELLGFEKYINCIDMFVVQHEKYRRIIIGYGDRHGIVNILSYDSNHSFGSREFSNVHNQLTSCIKFNNPAPSDSTLKLAVGSFDRSISLLSFDSFKDSKFDCSMHI